MKTLFLIGCFLLTTLMSMAQQQEGRIVYERTVQMQIRMAGNGDDISHMLPRTRTDKIEVLFANNQSIRRQLQEEVPDASTFNSGGGMQVRIMMTGMEDMYYYNFAEQRVVEQREFAAKKYIISDSIRKMNWKLTGETKTILGYACQQATSETVVQRMAMTVENGQMKREEVPDTLQITAWFAPAIPVSAGPEYQGQLPGLIMAIDVDNGRQVYQAVELSPKVDVKEIKEPKGGKKVTPEEFRKEREKVMEEMERSGGGRRRIRMGGPLPASPNGGGVG